MISLRSSSSFSSKAIRTPLRRKVLLPVAAMIILSMGLALLVVNKVVHTQVQRVVADDLLQKLRAFNSLQRGRMELLAQRVMIVAETPYLRAAIETRHPETIQRELQHLASPATDSLIWICDPKGEMLAAYGPPARIPNRFEADSFHDEQSILGAQIGVYFFGSSTLLAALAPVIVPDSFRGSVLLGYVLLGIPIDHSYLAFLEENIGCHFLFYCEQTILTSTSALSDRIVQTVVNRSRGMTNETPAVKVLETREGEFLYGTWHFGSMQPFGFVLLAPFGTIFQKIVHPVERTMLWVGLFSLLAAILISFYVSRMIVKPVQKLVAATDAVTTGDYDHPIAIESRDEIGYLADKFDTMRQSLQRQMEELARQNHELEVALQELEKTQQELVQSEKLAATGKITAQLSHELNNPIHNVRSCLETARRKLAEGKDAGEYLALAHDEIIRMGRLVQQMLDFYRPAVVEREPVDVNRIIEQVLLMSRDRLSEHQIRLRKRFGRGLPPILASPDQMKQVFLNLILNAIDAMPSGGLLEIRTEAHYGECRIIFRDTGTGIPRDKLASIFDAFYTTKSRASGVGLGLSVSYGIVKSYGGKIWVESQPGKGSTFTVLLPLSDSLKNRQVS